MTGGGFPGASSAARGQGDGGQGDLTGQGDLAGRGIGALREAVERTIAGFLAEQRVQMIALAPASGHLVDLVEEAVSSGGKRLRPTLCYAAYRLAGGEDGPEILRAAGSLELLHTSAILHDDVMDQAVLRRGRPALHRRLADERRGAGSGNDHDADVFGVSVAILAGDLAWVLSDALLAASGFDAQRLSQAGPALDTMRTQAIAGQYLDLFGAGASGATGAPGGTGAGVAEEEAAVIGRLKAAGYSVQGPVAFGAALAGASPDLEATLARFGAALGEAFFLTDELLGVLGDPAETGKDAESDLRRGKPITVIARVRSQGSAAEQAVIARHWGDPQASLEDLAAVRAAIRSSGALAATGAAIEEQVNQALTCLQEAGLADRPGGALLAGVTERLRPAHLPFAGLFG